MNPRRSNSSLPRPGRSAYGVATAVVLLLIPVIVLVGGDTLQQFLNFGAGVLSLVSLSCSVIWGLVAQDRVILNTRQRIVAQGIHRVTAVASIAFMLVHVAVKLALEHTTWGAALIPFWLVLTGGDAFQAGEPMGSAFLIGCGSLAAMLMIFVGITGALRNRFASPAPVAARWRMMHMLAYPAWCAALIHGLYAGRAVKAPIFLYLYELSLVVVMAALALRAAPRPVKRKVADRIAALMGTVDRPERDRLEESRARVTESALPGYESRRAATPRTTSSGPLFETAERPAAQEPVNGFAAAYRAVSAPSRPAQQQAAFATDQTAGMQLPLDMQPTETIPRMDGTGPIPRMDGTGPIPRMDGLSSTSGNWPIPSPPPVGEAPPSAYDPLQDTGYNIPVYGNAGAAGYGSSDVYDTGETNAVFGTYNQNDTYTNSGPATETLPGASYDFDAPGSGEPWNTPSGGFK
ncbi:ferric reductase-like transmembrane domain-containing protein [Streptomyces sp. NPDC052682]|uniref:ferric reductase-like transmembrane domain-containing protein n=1 Tax=Streptomyces sp. NPDC052682 TaxID=3154954 RepID=UPI00342BF7F9